MNGMYKSRDNAVVFGVIGGLGEYFNIDPVLLRVIVVVATFFGVGATIPIYLILALIMPEAPRKSGRHPSAGKNRRRSYKKEYYDRDERPKRKEAEKVEEEDWSDF